MNRRSFDEFMRRKTLANYGQRGYRMEKNSGIFTHFHPLMGSYIGPKSGMHHYDERYHNGSYVHKLPSHILPLLGNVSNKNLERMRKNKKTKKTTKPKNNKKNDKRSPNNNIPEVNGGSKFVLL